MRRIALAALLALFPLLAHAQVACIGPNCVVSFAASSVSGGTANAQTVSTTSGGFVLQAGNSVNFVPGNNNTSATTVNVDGTGAVTVHLNGSALTSGTLVANRAVTLVYDGTYFDIPVAAVVPGFNASTLLGATWAAPGNIGTGTPGTGAFTTLSASSGIDNTVIGANTAAAITGTTVTGTTSGIFGPSAAPGTFTSNSQFGTLGLNVANASGGPGGVIQIQGSRGTVASPSAIVNGDTIGIFQAKGYDGGAYRQAGAIQIISSGAVSSNVLPTVMTFSINGGAGSLIEAARFNNSGVLSVSSGLANSVTLAGSATNPTIGTSAGSLSVTPNVLFSGGASIGSTTAQTGGVLVANALSANIASSIGLEFPSTYGQISLRGADATHYSSFAFQTFHSDGSNGIVAFGVDNGTTAIATSAINGFSVISHMAGAPTGAAAGGAGSMVIDTTNHKICWNEGGTTWKCALGS